MIDENKIINGSLLLVAKGESDIEILKGFHLVSDSVERQIRDALNLGEQHTFAIFEKASWLFSAQKRFSFIPSKRADVRDDLYPIDGSYSSANGWLEFHAESKSPLGASASLDGFIQADGSGFIVEAIYSDSSSMSPPVVARILQKLYRETEPAYIDEAAGYSSRRLIQNELALSASESTDKPAIKVPAIYNVSISGRTEVQAFGPLAGKLLINPVEPLDPNPFLITLSTDGKCTNGWIGWKSFESFWNDPDTSRVSSLIQVEENQIRLDFCNTGQMPSTTWFTLPPDAVEPELSIGVRVASAMFVITVQGDKISGDIQGYGHYDWYFEFNRTSTYEARITGEIADKFIDELRTAIDISVLNSYWHAGQDSLGLIELKSDGQRLSGSFTGEGNGTIVGEVFGSHVDFTWASNQQRKGWGFARVIAGGEILAGMWGDEGDKKSYRILLATIDQTKIIKEKSFEADNLMDLRHFAMDLLLSGTPGKAAETFEKALSLCKHARQEGGSYLDRRGVLIDEASILDRLADCYFQLGDYDNMLARLEQAIGVQRLLSPDEDFRSMFEDRLSELAKAVSKNLPLTQYIQANLKSILTQIEAGYIGIQFSQDEGTGRWTITEITRDSPAFISGIEVGDHILAIDEQDVGAMNAEQIQAQLCGQRGTEVSITLLRRHQPFALKVNRARFQGLTTQREAEIVLAINHLSDSVERISNWIQKAFNLLEEFKARTTTRGASQVVEMESLPDRLINEQTGLVEMINEALLILKKTFKQQDELVGYAEICFQSLNIQDEAAACKINLQSLTTVEQTMCEAINRNNEMSPFDKQLFYECLKLPAFYTLAFHFRCEGNFIAQMKLSDLYQQNKRISQEYASTIASRLDSWRARLITDLEKITALDKGQPFLQKLIKFLIELGKEEDALIVSETARARAFADMIVTRSQGSRSEKERAIFENQVVSHKVAEIPKIEQIKQVACDLKATLIEYTIIDRDSAELLVWVVTPSGKISLHLVDLNSFIHGRFDSIEELVDTARKSFGVRGRDAVILSDEKLQNDESLLEDLYQLLIEPIARLLPDDPGSKIIFIPQGPLFLVPFAALKESPDKYLIEKHTILTAPSIQMLDLISKRHASHPVKAGDAALIVGNPKMPTLRSQDSQPPKQLVSLPGAEKEALELASILKAKALIGEMATRKFVIQGMPGKRFIHLATHGVLEDLSGLGVPGAIALTPSEGDDGFLTSREIIDLTLDAELVVLSACNTGRGQARGDGIVGLARSFILAGVSEVVVSLWAVSDESTVVLMKEFYSNFLSGMDKASALQQAMLKAKAIYQKPSLWAAFTLIGIV